MKFLAALLFCISTPALALDLPKAEAFIAKNFTLRLAGTDSQLAAYAKATGMTHDSVVDWAEASRREMSDSLAERGESYCGQPSDSRGIAFAGYFLEYRGRVVSANEGSGLSSGTVSFPIYSCYKLSQNLVAELVVDLSQTARGRTSIQGWFKVEAKQ